MPKRLKLIACIILLAVCLAVSQIPTIIPTSPITEAVIFEKFVSVYDRLRLYDADRTNYVALQSPTTVAADIAWKLPAADGSANQVMKTDGALALGWVSVSSLANVFPLSTKTDSYTVLTSDFGSVLVMNAAASKTFSLPSVDATNIGSWVIFEKMGAGEVVIDAADADTVEDSTAGNGVKCSEATTFARVSLYLRSATSWVIWNAKGTWASF